MIVITFSVEKWIRAEIRDSHREGGTRKWKENAAVVGLTKNEGEEIRVDSEERDGREDKKFLLLRVGGVAEGGVEVED